MDNCDIFFYRIANALLTDYSSVYYVNAVTGEYQWYSADPEFISLGIAKRGTDFFTNMKTDAEKVIYEEDLHIFTEDIQKENFFSMIENGASRSLVYRILIDGKPVYHTLRVIRKAENDADYFILGVKNIDKEVRLREQSEKFRKEREIYNEIAESLAEDFDTLYYVYVDTGRYFEFTSNQHYKDLKVPMKGNDFFAETRANVIRYVCPEDRNFAHSIYFKDKMLDMLGDRESFSYRYRLLIDGERVYYSFTVIRANDSDNLIVCVKNINDEVTAELKMQDVRKKSITYGQIAESLALRYDVIYCISVADGSYVQYTSNEIYGNLELREEGLDFYSDAKNNIAMVVHQLDRAKIEYLIDRKNLISSLEKKKQIVTEYRIVTNDITHYLRLSATLSADKNHFIIGVENIDETVKKEREQRHALNAANEMARRDELTGIKNKTAYTELERAVQSNIDSGIDYLPFAIVVCDINNLKQVNDSEGHSAGDEYIRSSAKLICDVFTHSPVFRIGGDEFVVFLRGDDYTARGKLLAELRKKVTENITKDGAPVIAAGISEFDQNLDASISDVFDRADALMYEDKKKLKSDNCV